MVLAAAVLITGCTATQTNWPGVSAAGDRVYIAYKQTVTAVDVSNKQTLWTYAGEGSNVQFFAPPSIAEDKIILGDYGTQGGLFSTGLTVSIYALPNDDTFPVAQWVTNDDITGRIFAQPLQVEDLTIVATSDNHVVAFNRETGAAEWDFRTGNAVWSEPAYADGTLYIASLDRNVYALDVKTGTEKWRRPLNGANSASPVYSDGRLYIGSFDRGVHALDATTGEELWFASSDNWVWGAPALANGVLYYTDLDGNVYAVDAETGKAVWDNPQKVEGSIQTQPVVVGDRIFIGSGDPTTAVEPKGYITSLSAEDGAVLWKQQLEGPVRANPVIVNDTLVVVVVSDQLRLIQLDLESGAVMWTFAPVEAG